MSLKRLWERIEARETTLAEEARALGTTSKRLRGELRRAGYWEGILPRGVPEGTIMRQNVGAWPMPDVERRRRVWDREIPPPNWLRR